MTNFFALAKSNRKRNLSQFILISFSFLKLRKDNNNEKRIYCTQR